MPETATEPSAPAGLRPALARSLLWPLRARFLGILAAVAGLGLSTVIPVLGPALAFGLVAALFHTGFRALEHLGNQGQGDRSPPPLVPDGDAVVRSVALMLVLMALAGPALVIWTLGGLPGALTGAALLTGLMPAAILRIGREHGLVAGLLTALNPAGLYRTIRTIGRTYAGVAAISLGLTGVTVGAIAGTGHLLVLPALLATAFLGAGYTVLVTFRLTAALAERHRQELGYAVRRPRPVPPKPVETTAREPTTDERVSALIKGDQLDEAAELLRETIKDAPRELHWWERYYRLLEQRGEDGPLRAASRGFLTALLRAGNEERAMEVIHAALNRDRDFQPARPEQVFRLARIARRDNRPGLALRIMNGFAQRCPDHPEAPMVLLFTARILADDFRKPEQAAQLLDGMLRTYADHPLAGEAHRLRQGLLAQGGGQAVS
jgi:hypothetical protein